MTLQTIFLLQLVWAHSTRNSQRLFLAASRVVSGSFARSHFRGGVTLELMAAFIWLFLAAMRVRPASKRRHVQEAAAVLAIPGRMTAVPFVLYAAR